MTPGEPQLYESWIERQLREAVERGEFDDLAGAGEPLAVLNEPYEPTWWVKRWIEREGISRAELVEALKQRSGQREVGRGV
jgi:hypothetical protein